MAALAKVVGTVDVQRLTDGTTIVKHYISAKTAAQAEQGVDNAA